MSKVSIAMAVYNGEKYLKKQLDSILIQLQETDELIISYDNSTDSTEKIIYEYADIYPQIIILKNDNPGVHGNFNNAIKHCTGDYIFISDQDDIWDTSKIETVVTTFQEKNADMVIHNGVNIDVEDRVISADFFSFRRITKNVLLNFIKPEYSGCCTAFNQKIKNMIVPIPKDIGGYDHWIGMIGEIFGQIVFIDDILIYHRIHDSNVTPTKRNKISKIFRTRFMLLRRIVSLLRYREGQ